MQPQSKLPCEVGSSAGLGLLSAMVWQQLVSFVTFETGAVGRLTASAPPHRPGRCATLVKRRDCPAPRARSLRPRRSVALSSFRGLTVAARRSWRTEAWSAFGGAHRRRRRAVARLPRRYSAGGRLGPAYADDVALLFTVARHLAALPGPFRSWEQAIHLGLAREKTTIVPLLPGTADMPAADEFRAVTATLPDGWHRVSFDGRARYLGYTVGPTAAPSAWSAPIRKWSARTIASGKNTLAPSVTLASCPIRAITCFSYGAALQPPPQNLPRLEQQLMAAVFRAPFCSYPRAATHNLAQVGLPSIPAARPFCYSVLAATAFCHASAVVPFGGDACRGEGRSGVAAGCNER